MCDTSFLYLHLDLLAPVVATVFAAPTEAHRLHYVVAAFADGAKLCDAALLLPPASTASASSSAMTTTTTTSGSNGGTAGGLIGPRSTSSKAFSRGYRRVLLHILQTRLVRSNCTLRDVCLSYPTRHLTLSLAHYPPS